MIYFTIQWQTDRSAVGKGGSIIRILRTWLPVLLALSLLIPPCLASAFGTEAVSVGIYQNKPLIFRDSDGVVKGIYADFLNAVAKENDWNLKWVDGAFAEGLEKLERGEIDLMTAIAWTEKRATSYDFTLRTVISNWGVFYVPRGIAPESILDLDGRTIAVANGDVYAAGFRELAEKFGIACIFVEVSDYPDVFEAIQKGEVQAGLVSRLYGLANEKEYLVERTALIITPTEIRFAAPKGRSMTLLQILDFSLVKMRSEPDSVLNRSIQNWLSIDPTQKGTPRWYLWVAGLGLGAIAFVSLLSLLLKRQIVGKTRELLYSRGELAREKILFERLFEESPDALVIENSLGNRILRTNKGFTKLFGYSKEEAKGRTLNELVVPPEYLEEGKNLDDEAGRGGQVNIETIRRRKDGSFVDVSLISVPVPTEEGFLTSYTIYRDISSAKHAQRVLVESRESIENSLQSMRRTWEQTIGVLASASETRDPYTAGHQRRVSILAEAIALEMGMEEDMAHSIRMAGLVHDIGKINVPAEILSKPGTLGDVEFALIRTHSEIGYEIMKGIELPWKVADMIRQHHERMDGSGYPAGLKGEGIMLEARIIAVADVVEAMSSHRPYRPSRGLDAALEEIENKKGSLFAPDVVDACLRLFREKNFTFPDAFWKI
ncbi:MAG: transporter substrate-binding domain-containing protein [Thermovirgaceae bacterium]|nr:transporter substrate-binding domain-containing protein [Thermovirgaceae bacterium]